MIDSYIEFLRYYLTKGVTIPVGSSIIDWTKFLQWTEWQSIVGIVFDGIQKGGDSTNIPKDTLLNWIGYSQLIENSNRTLNHRCVALSKYLINNGLDCCILKGQGNAVMYPNPFIRMPGDIDVWVQGKAISEIISFSRKHNPKGKACYHHVDYGSFYGVEVEIHYRPTFMNNLLANKRIQKWIDGKKEEQFNHKLLLPEENESVSVPTWEFNAVFQLSHIYRHVIQRGVGLKQIIDYYYLLKSKNRKDIDYNAILRYLKLDRIAGALMWVLKEMLGLEEKYLICPVDERRGRFLYNEILEYGNWGMDDGPNDKSGFVSRNIRRLKRDVRLMQYFPSECLWEPVFRIWHFGWRIIHR